jgi:hypothetical protein
MTGRSGASNVRSSAQTYSVLVSPERFGMLRNAKSAERPGQAAAEAEAVVQAATSDEVIREYEGRCARDRRLSP